METVTAVTVVAMATVTAVMVTGATVLDIEVMELDTVVTKLDTSVTVLDIEVMELDTAVSVILDILEEFPASAPTQGTSSTNPSTTYITNLNSDVKSKSFDKILVQSLRI